MACEVFIRDSKPLTTFAKIKAGEVFVFEGVAYVKCHSGIDSAKYNSFPLGHGTGRDILGATDVRPVKKVTIEL